MAGQTLIQDRLGKLGTQAAGQLDHIGELIPPAKEERTQMPFDAYRMQAETYMHLHPEDKDFKANYQAALDQYNAAAGG